MGSTTMILIGITIASWAARLASRRLAAAAGEPASARAGAPEVARVVG